MWSLSPGPLPIVNYFSKFNRQKQGIIINRLLKINWTEMWTSEGPQCWQCYPVFPRLAPNSSSVDAVCDLIIVLQGVLRSLSSWLFYDHTCTVFYPKIGKVRVIVCLLVIIYKSMQTSMNVEKYNWKCVNNYTKFNWQYTAHFKILVAWLSNGCVKLCWT